MAAEGTNLSPADNAMLYPFLDFGGVGHFLQSTYISTHAVHLHEPNRFLWKRDGKSTYVPIQLGRNVRDSWSGIIIVILKGNAFDSTRVILYAYDFVILGTFGSDVMSNTRSQNRSIKGSEVDCVELFTGKRLSPCESRVCSSLFVTASVNRK